MALNAPGRGPNVLIHYCLSSAALCQRRVSPSPSACVLSRFIKADYPACRRRSTHSLLPLDLLTPPVACPRGAHGGEGGGRDGGRGAGLRGPAATSHGAPVPGRGSYSSTLLCGAFWPLRVEGGGDTRLMPPAPPVWPQAQECDRLDAVRYSQPHMPITAG